MVKSKMIDADIDAALLETERAGLKLTLIVRTALIVAFSLFSIAAQEWPQGLVGAGYASIFLVIGLVYLVLVRSRRDRPWMRFGFVTLDVILLAWLAAIVPLSTGGDVPQIFVFRIYGATILFFVLATSALSLSPALVLWTGGAITASLWGAWGWIVAGMERRVSWNDLDAGASAEAFMAVVLDPDFTGRGNRVIETLLILGTAAVTAIAVQRARDMLRSRMAAERARAEATAIFGRFVPEEVVSALSAGGGALTPSAREATVLFVDVEGFTRFAEGADPARVVAVLDQFFETVSDVVADHDGVVVNLIGDAALVAFNAPLDNPRHAADGIAAAEALLRRCEETDFAGQRLAARIGVASGLVAAGSVGGEGRRAYTLYGDTVNLAQRLERLNKDLGGRLLVSEDAWTAAGAPPGLVHRETITVRGRQRPTNVYGPDVYGPDVGGPGVGAPPATETSI